MKYIVLFLFMFNGLVVVSQVHENSICWILAVKGEIRKPTDKKVVKNDTILYKDIPYLKFENDTSFVNLYESSLGSFRLTKKEIVNSKAHKNFFEFLTHLLKVKGNKISLTSRGSCVCLTPRSCFYTDTAINDKILIVDSLSFEVDDAFYAADKAFYYLRYKSQNRKLRIINGFVQLSPADFVFRDTSFTEGETPEFTIGLYTKKNLDSSSILVANVKFNIVSADLLREYYKALQIAMQERDLRKVYENFSQDVYIYFGKPTECQLEKIINSIN